MTDRFTRLVRFEDREGNIHYAEAGDDWRKELKGQSLPTYQVSSPWEENYTLTGKHAEVAKVR